MWYNLKVQGIVGERLKPFPWKGNTVLKRSRVQISPIPPIKRKNKFWKMSGMYEESVLKTPGGDEPFVS